MSIQYLNRLTNIYLKQTLHELSMPLLIHFQIYRAFANVLLVEKYPLSLPDIQQLNVTLLKLRIILFFRMITNTLQSDRLEFQIPNPFSTSQLQGTSKTSNLPTQSSSNISCHQTQLAFTNICFEDCKKEPEKQGKASRIHGKQAIKKIGMTHFLMFNKQRKKNIHQKDVNNTTLKSKIKQSQKKVTQSRYKQSPSEILEHRSMQLDEELKNLLTNRRSNEKTEHISSPKYKRFTTELMADEGEKMKENINSQSVFEPQMSKQVQHRIFSIQQDKEDSKVNKKEDNAFYTKLKSKLENEMKKIQDKNNKNKHNFLISGCEIFSSSRTVQVNYKSLTDRPRPLTALSRTGLEIRSVKSPGTDRRPQSSRSRALERKEILFISRQKSDLYQNRSSQPKKRTNKSLKENRQVFSQPQMNKTYRHITSINKQDNFIATKGEIEKQKVKQKVLDIIMKCEDETLEFVNLQSGLRAFESYTNKMNIGLKHTSKLIDGIQKENMAVQQAGYF